MRNWTLGFRWDGQSLLRGHRAVVVRAAWAAAICCSLLSGACRGTRSKTSPPSGNQNMPQGREQDVPAAGQARAMPARQPVALDESLPRYLPSNAAVVGVFEPHVPWRLAGSALLPEGLRAMVRSRFAGAKGPEVLGLDDKQPFAVALALEGDTSKAQRRLLEGMLHGSGNAKSAKRDKQPLLALRLRFVAKAADSQWLEKHFKSLVVSRQRNGRGQSDVSRSKGWSCRYWMGRNEALVACLHGGVLVLDELYRAAGAFSPKQLIGSLQAAGTPVADGKASSAWRSTFLPVTQARADASVTLISKALGPIALVHGLTQIADALPTASPEERASLLSVGMKVASIPGALADLPAAFDRWTILVSPHERSLRFVWHATAAGRKIVEQALGGTKAGPFDSLDKFQTGFLAPMRKQAVTGLPKAAGWDISKHRDDLQRGGVFALMAAFAGQWPRILTDDVMSRTLFEVARPVWGVVAKAFGCRRVTVERTADGGLSLRLHV